MSRPRRFATTLLSLGLAASLAGWVTAQAAEPSKPAAKSAESPPAPATARTVKELPFPDGEKWPTATEQE